MYSRRVSKTRYQLSVYIGILSIYISLSKPVLQDQYYVQQTGIQVQILAGSIHRYTIYLHLSIYIYIVGPILCTADGYLRSDISCQYTQVYYLSRYLYLSLYCRSNTMYSRCVSKIRHELSVYIFTQVYYLSIYIFISILQDQYYVQQTGIQDQI